MTDTTPIKLRIRLHFESIEDFIEGFAKYISVGGLFIPLAEEKQKPLGSTVRFQFLLKGGETALLGEGIVKQTQVPPSPRVGMLVKFKKLSKSSQDVVKRVVAYKKQRDSAPTMTPPPEPTQALHGGFSRTNQAATAVVKADPTLSLPSPPTPEATSLDFKSGSIEHQSLHTDSLGDVVTRAEDSQQVASALNEVTRAQDDNILPDLTPTPKAQDDDFFELAESYAGSGMTEESAKGITDPDDLKDQPSGDSFDFNLDLSPPSAKNDTDGIDAASLSPPQLATTEGGLSIMAYNSEADLSEESRGLAAFSLMEDDDDADIDAAFDDIFGGGGGDSGGGFDLFGSGGEQNDPFSAPAPAPPEPAPPVGPEPSAELESLLGSLEDENEDTGLTSLSLNLNAAPQQAEPDEEEEDNLADLLALARKDIESKKEDAEQSSSKDFLEQLLGDDVALPSANDGSFLNLPPPKLPTFDDPEEDSSVATDEEEEEAVVTEEETPEEVEEIEEEKAPKKSGLFSSLFRRRSDS